MLAHFWKMKSKREAKILIIKKNEKENISAANEEKKPEVKKNEFVRVAIEEDSDEESEPII